MDWSRYRFRGAWHIRARPEAVYQVLARPEEYPRWWPQIREIRRVSDTSGLLRFRSVLPYDLVVTAHESRHDPAAGVLEMTMAGDLEGWVRWTVRDGEDGGTRLVFEEDVIVRKPLMRRLAVPGRAVFRANHALMMRRGLRGLRERLDAGPAGGPADDPGTGGGTGEGPGKGV